MSLKKSATELTLTASEREALIDGTGLRSKLKKRLKSLPDDGIVIALSRKEIDQVALEASLAASNPLHPYALLLTEIDRKLSTLIPENAVGATHRRPRTPPAATNEVLQLRISLDDIEPEIWRRIQVENCTLAELHSQIQAAFGWENAHLHEFEIDGTTYGSETDDSGVLGGFFGGAMKTLNENEYYLTDFVTSPKSKPRWSYEYDFGDGWRHTIKFEGFKPRADEVNYPLCLAGERACPPEDCGGSWRYMDLLESLKQAGSKSDADDDDEFDELTEWYADLDPEEFDLNAVNERLQWRLRNAKHHDDDDFDDEEFLDE